MSRALTVYTRKRDEDTPEVTEQLERVMASTGCSEPVARNLLKYGKLGIGPLAQPMDRDGEMRHFGRDPWDRRRDQERPRQSPPRPPPTERTAASALAERKRKLREQEERLREQEEQREREVEEEEKARREEQARKRAGLTRLGPVLARPEEVDPLQPVPVEATPRCEEDEESDDDDDEMDTEKGIIGAQAKQKADKKRGQVEGANRKPGKKKRRRRRGGLASDGSSEEPGGGGVEGEEGAARASARPGDGTAGAEAAGERGRSASSAASSLMTEAQVMEMMGKDRKTKRGSLRAKTRIQREMEEWESAKRENPEFWKAPKFSLCYSAETRKSRNY